MELDAYFAEVTRRLLAILGDRLVGVYAGGSVALGAYVEGRSDVDVVAVTRGPLARETKERIAAELRHESLSCPARGLEFVVYAEGVTRRPSAEAGFELDLNTGARMPHKLELDTARVDDAELVAAAIEARGSGRTLPRDRVARFLDDVVRTLERATSEYTGDFTEPSARDQS